jgi:hypothetical protein
MNGYDSIKISNENILNDLINLDKRDDYDKRNEPKLLNNQSSISKSDHLQMSRSVNGKKVFLESPTFTKGEDDIYR